MLGSLRVYAREGSFYCAEFDGVLLAARISVFTGNCANDSLKHIGNVVGNHYRFGKSKIAVLNSPPDGSLDARCLTEEELQILSKAL